eukprot:TRINITY_DN11130_c0_g1_i4.p1 TRINITY_DN11130_c0_g1~~TRINITY_DN11130_c0_g1_i4.p1  ORF type:complete len:380 (+),score=73.51 TRINITY_DN11130_c0_g1_i4:55-1194(+)
MTSELPETFVPGFHDEEVVKKMKYRDLPNVGKVSILAFGGSGLGGMHTAGEGTGLVGGGKEEEKCVWWLEDPESDKEAAKEVLMAYLKSGGNIIDTSHWYGQGKSERLLGWALKDVPRKAYYILSKIGRYDKDLSKMFDFTHDRTYQGVKDSLKRLQLDYIDVMQVHDPEFAPSVDQIVKETVPALHKARGEGLIRNVGMTGYPIETQEEIIRKCHAAGHPIHTSLTYCRYTLNDVFLMKSKYWETCKELGIGVVNASPISMGLLMNREPPSWHPATDEVKAACSEAITYCKEKDVDISKLAIHFVLENEDISTTLVSTTSVHRCKQNMTTVHTELSDHERACMKHVRENIFAPRGDLHWEGVEIETYWKEMGNKPSTP